MKIFKTLFIRSNFLNFFGIRRTKQFHVGILLAGMLMTLLISGCSTDMLSKVNPLKTPAQHLALAKRFLNMGAESQPPYSTEYKLKAAEHLIHAHQLNEASEVIKTLIDQEKGSDEDLRRTLFEIRLSLLQSDGSRALSLIKLQLNALAKITGGISENRRGPRKIALLLPTHGPHSEAAKTIREGFLAAYYKSGKNQPNAPSVQVYDTDKGVIEAYQKAISESASMIVGPLTKPEVQSIAKIQLDVPVLALNAIPLSGRSPAQFYQFGLMPEDEVYATAVHAKQQGRSRALVIAPRSEWGQRIVTAFRDSFESNRGRVIEIVTLSSEEDLMQKIRLIITQGNKSSRRDIDMIFLAASPDFARKIKPLLDLYDTQHLPVYASASVYEGTPTPGKDYDLNGVHFCDMPWVLSSAPDLRETRDTLSSLWPQSFARSPRYFALGIDAYHLASGVLDNSLPMSGMKGMTGDLKIGNDGHVQRHLYCARFEQGVPVPD